MLAAVLLAIHVASAAVALAAGTVALAVGKGSGLHRRSGQLFVWTMLTMCTSAVVAALAKAQTMNGMAGTLTAYLVVTALTTVRPPKTHSRVLALVMMTVACAVGLTTFSFAVQAVTSPTGVSHGYPAYPFVLFALVGVLGGVGDVRVLLRGNLRGAPRLARHLWRMCVALLIATLSFFTVRARVAMIFPAPLVTPALQFTPILLVLLAMLYWLWRIRVRAQYLRLTQRPV